MNILFVSHLHGRPHAGPTYSVPSQVSAQASYDNVFWYNVVDKTVNDIWAAHPCYHDLNEYPNGTIRDLPSPFCRPDLIVVEGFYGIAGNSLSRELMQCGVPFILVPRGELTRQAQRSHRLKKAIANLVKCGRYARKAAAIQYLTKQENKDSGDKWNKNAIVIPNGMITPGQIKTEYSQEGIKCISIGRLEPYQKGLDLLIEACGEIKESLREAKCSIMLCGPDSVKKLAELKQFVKEKQLEDIITFHDGVFGDEKVNMLLEHDVYLMPSRFEGHPMALIEALSYGLPCVITEGSNMREEVETAKAGWTSDTSIEGIKDAIQRMIQERNDIRAFAQNAKVLAKNYDWDHIAAMSHDEYEKIIRKWS